MYRAFEEGESKEKVFIWRERNVIGRVPESSKTSSNV
jgi:hypothetical protein